MHASIHPSTNQSINQSINQSSTPTWTRVCKEPDTPTCYYGRNRITFLLELEIPQRQINTPTVFVALKAMNEISTFSLNQYLQSRTY